MKRKVNRVLALFLFLIEAVMVAEAQNYTLPPEDESQIAFVALEYMKSQGWAPIYIRGTITASENKYSSPRKVIVVYISPSRYGVGGWKYYEEGVLSDLNALYTGWSLCKPGLNTITILDQVGRGQQFSESSYHP